MAPNHGAAALQTKRPWNTVPAAIYRVRHKYNRRRRGTEGTASLRETESRRERSGIAAEHIDKDRMMDYGPPNFL